MSATRVAAALYRWVAIRACSGSITQECRGEGVHIRKTRLPADVGNIQCQKEKRGRISLQTFAAYNPAHFD